MWSLLAKAEPSISESSRRGQNEPNPLSPLGQRQFRSVFFFPRKPMARLAGNFGEFGTFGKASWREHSHNAFGQQTNMTFVGAST